MRTRRYARLLRDHGRLRLRDRMCRAYDLLGYDKRDTVRVHRTYERRSYRRRDRDDNNRDVHVVLWNKSDSQAHVFTFLYYYVIGRVSLNKLI